MQVTIYSGVDLKQFISECFDEKFKAHRFGIVDDKIVSKKPIKVKDVCDLTGYAESTIRCKVSNREIPFHKKGARVYFFEDEILNWIKEGRQKTKSEIEAEV